MSTEELRRSLRQRLEELSPERLAVVADFMAYLQEREADEATTELLRIPGFMEELKRAEDDAAAGRVGPPPPERHKRSA